MKNEDLQLVSRLVDEGLRKFAANADQFMSAEMGQVKQALDGANKNVLKLQAQVTALRSILVERGVISLEGYDASCKVAWESLVSLINSQKAEGSVEEKPAEVPETANA